MDNVFCLPHSAYVPWLTKGGALTVLDEGGRRVMGSGELKDFSITQI